MNPYEFLNSVLPSSGLCCISYKSPGKRGMINRPFQNRQEAADFALTLTGAYDVYFACSTFAAGRPFARKADNAVAQQAFWLDIDCKDCVQALGAFIKKTGVPAPSVVVNSGHGIHVYWLLTTPVTSDVWREQARALRALCDSAGLMADHHRTCDVASILRLPGTFNYKTNPPLSVEILYATEDRYEADLFARGSTPVAAPAVPQALAGNFSGETFTMSAPPRGWEDLVLNCEQIREMGSGSYPEWMLAARTVLCTTGGPAMVHALSARAPDRYDAAACDRLIKSLQNTAYGPGLCETFAAYRPDVCARCPFKGRVNTPWKLATRPRPEAVSIPALSVSTADLSGAPIPVADTGPLIDVVPFRSADGMYQVVPGEGVIYTMKDKDGVPCSFNILPIELYIHTLCVDSTGGRVPKRTYIMRKVAKGSAPVDIPFTLEEALGATKMELWLGECGMHPRPKWKKQVHDFMNTYIATVQNSLPVVYTRGHFGWDKYTDPGTGQTCNTFVLGHAMYMPQGVRPVRLDERAEGLSARLGSKGTLDAWKQVPRLYRELNQPFAQLLMCAAFGAPLMYYGMGTATNVAYSFWDIEGGKGKSSLLRAMSSVWGDPALLLMGRTDTHAARFQQYAVYRNLPVMIDEITGMHDEDLASILYDIVNGREKSRSTSSGTGLAISGNWATITAFTANQSVYEHLRDYRSQTSATCMRVIEMTCDFVDYSGRPEAAMINNAMAAARENYGLAGVEFIRFIVAHPEVVQAIARAAEQFYLKHSKSSDERFWLYGIAMPLYAGALAKDLGLIDYDMVALEDWCVNSLLPDLRYRVKKSRPVSDDLLAAFINDTLANTLVVQARSRAVFAALGQQGRLARVASLTGQTLDAYVVQFPRGGLTSRYELDTRLMYVSSSALRQWCKSRGLSIDALITEAARTGRMPQGKDPHRQVLATDIPQLPQARLSAYCFKVNDGSVFLRPVSE